MSSGIEGKVPLVLVEEHHEAFYAWYYGLKMGWLAGSANTLLHVDAHADMMLPVLRYPFSSIPDLAGCADFVYRELDISTFIWPAVYNGLFSRLLWLKNNHRLSTGGWRTITIYPKNQAATEFALTSALQDKLPPGVQAVTIEYSPLTTADVLPTDQPIVLDIDLDYFCTNKYPDPSEHEIEVTEETYNQFLANPYHLLRVSPLVKISAASRDDRYYLVYNDYYPERPSLEENLRTIELRLRDFLDYLHKYNVVPKMILVCRSVHSGYTPRDSADFLQRHLLQQLGESYDLAQHHIHEILPWPPAKPLRKEGWAWESASIPAKNAISL